MAEEKQNQEKALPENLEHIIGGVNETSKDIDEIQEDVEEIHENVEELQEDVKEIRQSQKSLLQRFSARLVPEEFAWDDLAQQIVGAIILSTPLAVTQEVWMLSQGLDAARIATIILITLVFNVLLIYHTKYQLVKEQKIFAVIPLRLLSQMIVSYTSAAVMLFVFGVIGGQVSEIHEVVKLVIFVGLFANIGAGTADMLK